MWSIRCKYKIAEITTEQKLDTARTTLISHKIKSSRTYSRKENDSTTRGNDSKDVKCEGWQECDRNNKINNNNLVVNDSSAVVVVVVDDSKK